jgi:hypothetical protein
MRREVTAYHDPITRGLIEIEDVVVPDENSHQTTASDMAASFLRLAIPPFKANGRSHRKRPRPVTILIEGGSLARLFTLGRKRHRRPEVPSRS